MNNTKLKQSTNPNHKLYLLNGYNNLQNYNSNNLFNNTTSQQQQQHIILNKQQNNNNNTNSIKSQAYPQSVDKLHKLEIEKLNLEYQVRLLKKQLNADIINMIQHQHLQQHYSNNNNNNNNAKILLMAMSKVMN